MKGFRFYLEHASPKDKRQGKDKGSVLAVNVADRPFLRGIPAHEAPYVTTSYEATYEAVGSLFDWSNSDVCGTAVGLPYLRTHCKRISEARAREVHPALFERLDMEG